MSIPHNLTVNRLIFLSQEKNIIVDMMKLSATLRSKAVPLDFLIDFMMIFLIDCI